MSNNKKKVYTDPKEAYDRVGVCTPTYKVVKFIGMTTTNNVRDSHGHTFDITDAVYECQCTVNPEHPNFTRTGRQIDKRPNQTGCTCCVSQGNADRATQKAIDTWVNNKLGGAKCIRYIGTSKHSGPVFTWVCPFCGNEFEKPLKLLKLMAANHDQVDCGCQEFQRRCDSQAKHNNYAGGLFSARDPLTAKKANMAREIISRTSNPTNASYKNFGGRTMGNPITRDGDWNTGDYVTDVKNIVDWLTDQGLTIDDTRRIGRRNFNANYSRDNCILVEPDDIVNNRAVTVYYQYGNKVFTGTEASALFNYSTKTLIKHRTPTTVSKDMYEREHAGLMLKLHKNGEIRDQDGFVHVIPKSYAFFRYPDWHNGPIDCYQELGPRILENIANDIVTRVIRGWTTEEELIALGVDPNNPLIEWTK